MQCRRAPVLTFGPHKDVATQYFNYIAAYLFSRSFTSRFNARTINIQLGRPYCAKPESLVNDMVIPR